MYLFTHTVFHHNVHISWCFYRLAEIRWVSLGTTWLAYRTLEFTYSFLGFALLSFYCFSVVFVDHCLSLWPLDCMYNRYNTYRLTTYDYPFGILNLLHYLSTYNFSFMCMFCRSLFVLLYFFLWSLYCLLRYTDSDSPFWYLKTLLWLFVIYVRITTIYCFPKLYHIKMLTQIINQFQISTIVTNFSFNYIHL